MMIALGGHSSPTIADVFYNLRKAKGGLGQIPIFKYFDLFQSMS